MGYFFRNPAQFELKSSKVEVNTSVRDFPQCMVMTRTETLSWQMSSTHSLGSRCVIKAAEAGIAHQCQVT